MLENIGYLMFTGIKTLHFLLYHRFLCDYIYYKSLHLGKGICAFVHVPRVDSPYSVEELTETLRLIVLAMVKELS